MSRLRRKGTSPNPAPQPTTDPSVEAAEASADSSGLIATLGWVSAALGAVALGLVVGREIRQRYKFNRRTPYDLYSHSGDDISDVNDSDVEFGVGI